MLAKCRLYEAPRGIAGLRAGVPRGTPSRPGVAGAVNTTKPAKRRGGTGPGKTAFFFLLPSLLILTLFTAVPLLIGLGLGFFEVDIFLREVRFAGLANYQRLVSDARFWNAVANTLYFAGVQMPCQVALALLTAVFISRMTPFCRILRSVFFLPVVTSLTAMGIVWSMLLDPVLGTVPHFLVSLGLPRMEFLKDPALAMPSVILVTVWKNFGLSMMILLAGIQGIPESYYEAARIDGAGEWALFRHVTLPLLVPALGFCVVTNTIGSLQVFDQVFVMTRGGPLFRTETLVQYIYHRGFQSPPYNLGYASAIAQALFLMIAAVSLLLHKYLLTRETTEV